MRAGIDIGISNVDMVLETDTGEHHRWCLPVSGHAIESLERILNVSEYAPTHGEPIVVTGVGSMNLPDSYGGSPIVRVLEFDAIGAGALAMAALDGKHLVVSAGTGTALVLATAGHYRHLGGSGVGGGTLMGLAALLLQTSDPNEIDALATNGRSSRVDLRIRDLVDGNLGDLPAEATAVHLGRLASAGAPPNPSDLAAALVGMLAESMAVLAMSAARAANASSIIAIGNMNQMQSWVRVFRSVIEVSGGQLLIPEHAGSACARGAMLCAPKQMQSG